MRKKTLKTTLLWLTLLRKPSGKSSNDLTTTTTIIITLNTNSSRNNSNSLPRIAVTAIHVVPQQQDVDLFFTVGEATKDLYLLMHDEFTLSINNNNTTTTILFLPRTKTNITTTINSNNLLE